MRTLYVNITENVLKKLIEVVKSNKILFGIIFLAFVLRFVGLYPNFINHPDEGWVQTYSAKLFYNIVLYGNFNPQTYKYGSFIFYFEAIPYFPIIFFLYLSELTIGKLFFSSGIGSAESFKNFVINLGPTYQNIFIFWSQRAFVALLGVLSVWITYFISKKLFNKPIAILSALFLAVMPLHVRDSHYITTDVPTMFFVLLAIFLMIKLYETGKLKWYILSGFMIGFSTSIKYFPIAFLIYPIAVFLDKNKKRNKKKWLINIFIGLLAVIPGLFIGVPFILSPGAKTIFQQDFAKWVTPWYTTSITDFLTSSLAFLTSHGSKPFPSASMLIPTFFFPYYLNFLFFRGVGPLLSIVSILGLILLLIKSPKKFLFLIIIPLFVFFYISFYLHAQYERLAIPMLPFIAIFAAVFFYYTWRFFKRYQLRLLLIAIFLVSLILPLTESFSSSWACGGKTVYEQSQEWIAKNIPDNSKIAYKTYTAFPVKPFNLFEIKPNQSFSLEEARTLGASYAFVNKTNTLDYYAYRFMTDFFIPPQDIYQNNFVPLSLYEYSTRAHLLKKLSQPDMCEQDTFLFYKLPIEKSANHIVKKFNFKKQKDFNLWHILSYSLKSKVKITRSTNSLVYEWQNINYTAPRVISEKIPVQENKTYTFSGLVESDQKLLDYERDGFLRIDFYTGNKANTVLPGKVVALSPRIYGNPEFTKLSVSVLSPKRAKFAILSLQVNGTKPSSRFYFKDLEFLGP